MAHPEIKLPENADKLLFAEDLVSYVMTRFYFMPYEGTQATPYRDLIFVAFNDTVRTAIDELVNRLHRDQALLCDTLDRIRVPTAIDYIEMIDQIRGHFSTDGFDPKRFILFCTNVAVIGAIMRRNGLNEAPNIAVTAIYNFIKNADMLATGWNTLTVLSSTLATLSEDRDNILTPKSLSPAQTDANQEDDGRNNLNEEGVAQQRKNDGWIHNEENEMQVDIVNALCVNINACTENLALPSMPTSKELLQPNAISEWLLKNKSESTNETLSYSNYEPLLIPNIECENLLPSCSSRGISFETADSFQEFKTAARETYEYCEAEVHLTDAKGEKPKADSAKPRKSPVLKEDASHLCSINEGGNSSEDSCTVTKHEDHSESYRLPKSLSPSSDADLQED